MERLNGDEKFSNNIQILDFWRWAHSDLLCNTERGILAEYIVAMAIGVENGVRKEWESYDLLTHNNIKVEVKSSAYLQSWNDNRLSKIRFDIRPTKLWNSKTNIYSEDSVRRSDVYVFCLFDCLDRDKANLMDLKMWKFYVVKTAELNEQVGDQKSISISRIKKLEHKAVCFNELKMAIESYT